MLKENITFIKIQRFIKNESGAILLPFIVLLPFFVGLIFVSFEISHFIQKKARLSDAIEQAALALTVENNDNPNSTQRQNNNSLVNSYARAYLPSEYFSIPIIEINSSPDHIRYNVAISMNYPVIFLNNTLITQTNNNISTIDNGAAKKYLSNHSEPTDVIFVADYSGSMRESFEYSDSNESKIESLRRILEKLNDKIDSNDAINIIGFVPFSWGTKIIVGNETFCHFPFVPKEYKPNGDYLRQYTASGLKKFQGLENLGPILNTEYGKLSNKEEDLSAIDDEIKSNIFNKKQIPKALDFLNKASYIDYTIIIWEIIADNIDYDKTIKSITRKNKTKIIDIPMADVLNKGFCLKDLNSHIIENNNNSILSDALNFDVSGGTLISSGILAGNNIFRGGSHHNKKIMIILSDGDDSNHINSKLSEDYKDKNYFNITKTLVDKGMCEKIKENNIRMVFIGIGYVPREDIDWKKCVGENNFYLAHNAHELEQDLEQVLLANDEVGRNIPKN
ncbi:pilus assembly protein [Yersinia rochesterensis]|uniref:TadE/TadG family type IV pilus assembly protein n=1 Tax=Yersinia TaxID=629 RepID=UPI0022402D74|nr:MULTISPECIES: pilus assembly protein [Yersinia]MDA5544043.1 pilus assembly protein [Yersinia rochesterensis]UZM74601.1 pilus assembly protein [Yersinia sp. SCPM-O-B-9106 (C-191)]